MGPLYPPGDETRKQFSGYNTYQDALWQSVADVTYAAAYGFDHTRQPTPGVPIPGGAVDRIKRALIERSQYEVNARFLVREQCRPFTEDDLPPSLWAYLTERHVAAKAHQPLSPGYDTE